MRHKVTFWHMHIPDQNTVNNIYVTSDMYYFHVVRIFKVFSGCWEISSPLLITHCHKTLGWILHIQLQLCTHWPPPLSTNSSLWNLVILSLYLLFPGAHLSWILHISKTNQYYFFAIGLFHLTWCPLVYPGYHTWWDFPFAPLSFFFFLTIIYH